MDKSYKIIFEHQNNANNEYELESAWATRVGEHYKLDNILFYAPQYSWNDVVSVEERSGELYVTGLVKESGHSTVRILFNDPKDVQGVRDQLKKMGCDSEISNTPSLVAVDIPPEVSYSVIRDFLEEGEKAEKWGYEESCLAQ
jgi:Domain of unknown function (DUF4265)